MEANKQKRDEQVDAMRGWCVLVMAVHHCINYFPGYSLLHWRFVSGAFPFLAGYLMTSILVGRRGEAADRYWLGWRLLTRGLKLIALCLALNAIMIFLLQLGKKGRSSSLIELIGNVVIYGDYKTISFSLLVPIGYTIAIGGLLLVLGMMRPKVIGILCGVLFSYCLASEWFGRGEYYLALLSIGVFGMAAGYASDWIVRNFLNTAWSAVVPWLSIQALITTVGKTELYPIYIANVLASLLFIGFAVQQCISRSVNIRALVLLGRYSLLLYLVQIMTLVLLQSISKKLGLSEELSAFWIALFVVTSAQVLIVEVTDRLRNWSPFSDRVYRFVLQ